MKCSGDRFPETLIRLLFALSLSLSVGLSGCATSNEVALRRLAHLARLTPGKTIRLNEISREQGNRFLPNLFERPDPLSERTQQVLRRYGLIDRYSANPDEVISWLKDICDGQPEIDELYALSEICRTRANWSALQGDDMRATRLYASAVVHAYQFLFDDSLDLQRNAYDPQFRAICDVYNGALQELIRSIGEDGLKPESVYTIGSGDLALELHVEVQGRWRNHPFEKIELANDYETAGIENLYHTYGLGVPLIAVHLQDVEHQPAEKYYPQTLPLPMTAFFEVDTETEGPNLEGAPVKAHLKLFDPLETTNVVTRGRTIPLESDLTTPLAYTAGDPLLSTSVLATASLINPEIVNDLYGLYMLEPFDPDKIPVLMVHGLWSSPVTWLDMFNDLRANRDLRENYQVWFYAYPTGQPFWVTARQLRQDLKRLKSELDPENTSRSLDQMVMVGHSMGGLVSRLQTINSGDEFWNLISDMPFESLKGDMAALLALKETFFFQPNPDVKRVVMIATPSNGSSVATSTAKWLSHNLFTLPELVATDFKKIARENQDKLRDPQMLGVTTSIDSLAPESPFFDLMLKAGEESDVPVHSIYGVLPESGLFPGRSSHGDGVVSSESATADRIVSSAAVDASHSSVHQHPRAILEVRRILIEHLAETGRLIDPRLPVIPTSSSRRSR